MDIIQRNGLLCPIADIQQLPQAFRHSGKVDVVQNIRRVFTVPPQVAGRNAKVMGLEVLCQHLQRKAVVDVLHHPVDGAGQLVPVVEITQVPEMPLVLVAAQ